MSKLTYEEILDKLIQKLPPKRFRHTLGVAYTATSLAMVYGVDVKKAEIAGLLHDCAKGCSFEEMLSFAKEHNMVLSDLEAASPNLLHAKVGGEMAKMLYGVEDDEIVDAILYHTTGRPGMSLMEKIVYIADYIEPLRDKQKRLNEIRKMAFVDIDKALLYILEDTMEYLKSTNTPIDTLTEKTYLYYKEN